MSIAQIPSGSARPLSSARLRLERAIEAGVDLLDQMDGCPDLEPNGDSEPDADHEASLCGVGFGWGDFLVIDGEADGPAFRLDQGDEANP